MSEDNRARSRRWFQEVWNEARTETIDELLAADGIGHMEPAEVVGVEGFRSMWAEMRRMFPDLQFTIEATAADDDLVAIRWLATGTHTGDGMGLAATQQPISIRGTTWHRYQDGKVVEGWDCWNQAQLRQQLQTA